jgi:hypothetical protein
VRGIGKIAEIGAGQGIDQCGEDRQTSQPGIKYTDHDSIRGGTTMPDVRPRPKPKPKRGRCKV